MSENNEEKEKYHYVHYVTTVEHMQAYCEHLNKFKISYSHNLKALPDFVFLCEYLRNLNRHGAEKIAYIERLFLKQKWEVDAVLKMVRNYLYQTQADYYNRYHIYSIIYPHLFIVSSAVCMTGLAYNSNPKSTKHDGIWRRIIDAQTMQEVTESFQV